MRAPELSCPRIRTPPSVDDATRLGVIEIDLVVQRHPLQRADGAAEAEAQASDLADVAFRLRYPARVLVQDVSGSDGVDVRPGRIAIIGAKNVENPFRALGS